MLRQKTYPHRCARTQLLPSVELDNLVLHFGFLMANLLPTSLTDGERSHDDTDNDASDAPVGIERKGSTSPLSIKAHRPLLFHKIQNQTSILALLISDSKIYAGTQSGDLLVCYYVRDLKFSNCAYFI